MKQAFRIETRMVKEQDFPYDGREINNYGDILDLVSVLSDCDVEKFVVLFMNNRNKLIGLHYYNGSVTQVHTPIREIMKLALLTGTTKIILVHNHPSGVAQPSSEDLQLTQNMQSALDYIDVSILDHVIIAGDTNCSLRAFVTGQLV